MVNVYEINDVVVIDSDANNPVSNIHDSASCWRHKRGVAGHPNIDTPVVAICKLVLVVIKPTLAHLIDVASQTRSGVFIVSNRSDTRVLIRTSVLARNLSAARVITLTLEPWTVDTSIWILDAALVDVQVVVYGRRRRGTE